MSRKLDDLDPKFKPLAIELLARCVEQRIHVIIVDTLRTPEEHQDNLARGVSWTKHSKHLDGLAIDIAPVIQGTNKVDWNPDNTLWSKIGAIGESLGLVWGGRWKNRDMGHFELPTAKTERMIV